MLAVLAVQLVRRLVDQTAVVLLLLLLLLLLHLLMLVRLVLLFLAVLSRAEHQRCNRPLSSSRQ